MAQSANALKHHLLLLVFLATPLMSLTSAAFNRSSFPADFVFGAGSSAYQYEGAWNLDGKGLSIWDTFTHTQPWKIADGKTGDVALDFYHRYKDDVKLLKSLNMDAFRFSISWTRILPNGSLSGGINHKGVEFYNNLINELVAHGMKPYVTIFHFDTPQGLENKYGGFLSPNIVDDYVDFAKLCFREFGDRVKHWSTFNEPYVCSRAYGIGTFAPGRCSPWAGYCTTGDSGREPYIACHHLLLAHAAAVKIYKEKYQVKQKGLIGITLVTNWFRPYSNSKADILAQQRSLDFMFGWFMNPLSYGNYPSSMRMIVGNRLPRFTKKESEMIKGSFDFIGVNYYTTWYSQSVPPTNTLVNTSFSTDTQTNQSVTGVRLGKPIGPTAGSDWLFIYPPGIRNLLLYIKDKYNNPLIYIMENGVDDNYQKNLPLKDVLEDNVRVIFYYDHLRYVLSAIRKGVNVKAYFAWSFFDDFE
ncbi:LOW QUALITY PROTEIN: beta-glucosidase 13-like [Dioscorea cayenensis subsp. rotundata]|uniref:LOW QUALITY PROTEIN: beta-glucosidase 13-like n=1 Tax=Dioscorea cayennensis subsp. rotundata TaxID=55577 RepID=A0AB40AS75_DIOCR|nr:LOW QUALITY PROTEIN: beta-glucosidase 13-like [Dioscorea cayenensis subsp. rotundata]